MHKTVHKSSVPDSYTLLFILNSYLNVSVLISEMYVYMHVCTMNFLKTTTNSLFATFGE